MIMQYVFAIHNALIDGKPIIGVQTNVCATFLTKNVIMPVQFLTEEQRTNYGCYIAEPTAIDLARYFHLDDDDHQNISAKRGDHNRLGFALQLTTVRYLGSFLDIISQAPANVLTCLARQCQWSCKSTPLWSLKILAKAS